MKKSRLSSVFSLILMSLMVSSCSAIEGIFKAGMGFGIFLVLAVFVIIVFIILKIRQKE
jgi:hypothetical protein